MKYEIEVDEELLKGWKIVAFKEPMIGDYYVSSVGPLSVLQRLAYEESTFPAGRIIVRPIERKFKLIGYKSKSYRPEKGQFLSMYNSLICASGHESRARYEGAEIWEEIYDNN